MMACVAAMGLYRHVNAAMTAGSRSQAVGAIRLALDAIVSALTIGQRSVEGARRLATPSAGLLLRARSTPSPDWLRKMLSRIAQGGTGERIHFNMACEYLKVTQATRQGSPAPIVFYVDGHLRPYSGGKVLRKGWRMQDKRAVPGASDYYVHDESGRPVFRVDVPAHGCLTDWLTPIAEFLREALGPDDKILIAFDRAGSFPEQMADLRNEGFEFVTYERKPFPALPKSAFREAFDYREESLTFCEGGQKNLSSGHGRVRRIAIRRQAQDAPQMNILAISQLPAARLYAILRNRWCQKNGLKQVVERWGANQLDGRKTEPCDPEMIIPDPLRRRLDHCLRIARAREARARRELATLKVGDHRYIKWKTELAEALAEQTELEALRPAIPVKAPLRDTDLADILVQHSGDYKTLLDAVRIACANVESELACILADGLARPAEAKKTLANLLAAPGSIHVSEQTIVARLEPAGTKRELEAMAALLGECNSWDLSLPGDNAGRRLRFELDLRVQ
jgi:hypothetical protein